MSCGLTDSVGPARAAALILRPMRPTLAAQIAAGVVMDTYPMTFDPATLSQRWPGWWLRPGYWGAKTRNSFPSGSASMTAPYSPIWSRVAPRATSRSISAC